MAGSKEGLVLRLPASVKMLPDLRGWTNRFEVRSASSNRIYIIAQNISKRFWGCSCPGWLIHRKCKHLQSLGLPCFEKPHEVKLVK